MLYTLNDMYRSLFVHILILTAFLANAFGPIPMAQADDFRLSAPGAMVHLSPEFNPPILKGIKVHPDNPFRFDFILDQGDSVNMSKAATGALGKEKAETSLATKQSQQEQPKQEATKLIKY